MAKFGEYLVSKKVISIDDLAYARLRQESLTPSILEVLFSRKIINAHQALELALETDPSKLLNKISMQKFWTQSVQGQVQLARKIARLPLGHVLVKENLIDLKTLNENLKNYLQAIGSIGNKEKKIQMNILNPNDFLESFSQNHLNRFQTNFFALKSLDATMKLSDLVDACLIVLKDLHTFKGAARFSDLKELEMLIESFETIIGWPLRQFSEKQYQTFYELTYSRFDSFLNSVQQLKSGGTVDWDGQILKSKADLSILSEVTKVAA